jgi:hypothetical protein
VLALAIAPVQLFADTILLTLHSIPGSVPVLGAGTTLGIVNLGTVSAFEPLGAGVSRTIGPSSFRISTQFGLRVVRVLGSTTSYTLRAQLRQGRPIPWRIDGVSMNTGPQVVATLQPYGTILPHTVDFTVSFATAAGALDASFDLTAIAN